MCTLRHKNIVNVFGALIEKPRLGIVMEFCAGGTLFQWILQQKLSTTEKKFSILLQIAQAMKYLHDKEIVHRDLKTANILVRIRGTNLTI